MTHIDTLNAWPDAAAARTWDRVAAPLAAFHRLVATADRQGRRPHGLPAAVAARIPTGIHAFEALLQDVIGEDAPGSPDTKAAVGARVRADLLPYLLRSPHAARWCAKPRGYAGDYLTIAQIYQDRAAGADPVATLLDRGFLDLRAARAVKNRRALLVEEILRTVTTAQRRPARVTSLACGPAQEIHDAFAVLDDPTGLRVSLLDQDPSALAHAAEHLTASYPAARVELLHGDLVPLATGRREPPVRDQDLVYSIGLIDYFPDRFVVGLMNAAHRMLRPGGRLILGNFHPRNTSRALMDHVLDWRLIHRTEADLDRLFRASRFGCRATRIRFEQQRINLFAECVRSA